MNKSENYINKKWKDCVEGDINSTVSLCACSPDNVYPAYRDNFSTINTENSNNLFATSH